MVSNKLVKLIEANADELTRRLMKDLLSREETKSYRDLSEDLVYERVYDVYSRLDHWLGRENSKGAIKRFYVALGKKRYREGIPLHELIMTFMLIKRHLWMYILEKQFFDSTYEINQSLELNNRVVLFFDRIIFFACIGYEEEMEECPKRQPGILSRLFGKG